MHTTIQGHEIYYEVHGTSGAPVLLLMGFGISGRAWTPQVQELEKTHRVALYDNRGIGGSERSRVSYDLETLAHDAIGLLNHLGWDRAHMVGVSMGGMVLQHLALAHPDRVRSLTLIATHSGPILRGLPSLRGVVHFLVANTSTGDRRMRALRRLLYPQSGQSAANSNADWLLQNLDLFATPADRGAVQNQLKAVLRHRTTPRLSELSSIPTLVLHGAKDLLIGVSAAKRLHRLISGSRMEIFPDAGHGLTHQKANEVNQLLLRHFQEADEDASS